jgi:hypothetical protein
MPKHLTSFLRGHSRCVNRAALHGPKEPILFLAHGLIRHVGTQYGALFRFMATLFSAGGADHTRQQAVASSDSGFVSPTT